ncbi:MAG: Fic family protein [Alphaproteobacteria bacterium]
MWNWQQKNWPNFIYNSATIEKFEKQFLLNCGIFIGSYDHINTEDKNNFIIDIISEEALRTSEIEGEYLNRESVQSSIRRKFGLDTDNRKISAAEQGIAEMMIDLYNNFSASLSHNMMFNWHSMLTNGRRDLKQIGSYRTHEEEMQVISGPLHNPKIHFEAPPSKNINKEIKKFIEWYNNTAPNSSNPLPPLARSSIAHLYFVSIHPFEDGNGRIARALAEKALSQNIGSPALISISHRIQKFKKLYYEMLKLNNKSMEITNWIEYFSKIILYSQQETQDRINFTIKKTKFYDRLRDQLNPRQAKVIARIFEEGLEGFKGGLSAENYINITKTSRATATRDFQDLITKSALIKKGERKFTRYYLNI